MMLANRVPSGMANGTKLAVAKTNNFNITYHSSPFPTKSSTYFHTNCMTRINSVRKKVAMNGPKNDPTMSFVSLEILT